MTPLTSDIETSSSKSCENFPPPPDGGFEAWMQVAMAHLAIINTWGTINTFGIFQTWYSSLLPSSVTSSISWIGSAQIFLLFLVGPLTGRMTDAGYFRAVFLAGSVLVVLGSFMTSLSTTYWQILLSQGVCIGIGMGGLFCPVMAILSTYFQRKRNVAIGIAISGSATGGMVYPAMVHQLLPQIGFPWTMRAMACVQLATLLLANLFLKPRLPPRSSGPLLDLPAFKELPYSLYAAGSFFNFAGAYVAFYYIGAFSRDKLGFSYGSSIDVLMIMNGVGAIGRVLPGLLADLFVGPVNVIIPASLISMVLLYIWTVIETQAGLYVFAVIYGIFGATVQGLFPAGLSSMTTDLSKAGTRMGMVYFLVAFGTLLGPPLAGIIISKDGGEYKYAFIFAGTCLCLGSLFLIACRISKGGRNWLIKV
ncbi:major facilitator superfamily domain-containing protein [Xylariales sp. PMI_506]|nr:major facilitator superfamily domain-containing protein [Xylariales sp. PMI_506]